MKRYKSLFNETHPYYVEKYIDINAIRRTMFYENEDNKYSWVNFKVLLEAVIRPDRYVSIVTEELHNFLKKYHGESFKYAFKICFLLNEFFSKYNFEFIEREEGGNDYKSGIDEAGTLSSNLKITFYCNRALKDLFVNEELQKKFLIDFSKLLGHELVHRGQFLNKQDEKVRKDIFNLKQPKGNQYNRDVSYYSRKYEIMAYAWMIIEELRFNGYSTQEILNIIKNNKLLKNESPILEIYQELFTIEDTQLKRLYKYIYEYIHGNIRTPRELNIIDD